MTNHSPALQTVIVVAVFAAFYMRHLLRRTLRESLDLYDLFMLSMIAVVPAAFVFFPRAADTAAELAGVAFPFVLMFGALLAVVFALVHRLTVRIHRLETQNRLLIQEVSLMRGDEAGGATARS
jgi:hypothetical protein